MWTFRDIKVVPKILSLCWSLSAPTVLLNRFEGGCASVNAGCLFFPFLSFFSTLLLESTSVPSLFNRYSYKKRKTFWPTSHYLTTDPNPLLPLAKRDCVTKNFETQVIPRRQIPFRKRNSRGTFCSYKSETCKKSKSLVSLTYLPERPCKRNTKKIFFRQKTI